MKKVVVIGANEFQLPLIEKVNELGYESHVIAWEDGAIAKDIAFKFYPTSIMDKEKVLDICEKIGAHAVLTAGSDLAVRTVNYVCKEMGLIGNSELCTLVSTNKFEMRKVFQEKGIPSPKFIKVNNTSNLQEITNFKFPLIVKPTDRSGSRGITKIYDRNELETAVQSAIEQSFSKEAIIEEYIEGNEYSVEMISYKRQHHFLNITQKYTTGSPHFIETLHLQPAIRNEIDQVKIENIISEALDALDIEYGASHSELKIMPNGEIKIIEIGSRMGGDYIGSHLVCISVGFDFLKAIIDVALGNKPLYTRHADTNHALVKFIFNDKDLEQLVAIEEQFPGAIYKVGTITKKTGEILSSSDRYGHYILQVKDIETLTKILGIIEDED